MPKNCFSIFFATFIDISYYDSVHTANWRVGIREKSSQIPVMVDLAKTTAVGITPHRSPEDKCVITLYIYGVDFTLFGLGYDSTNEKQCLKVF